MSKPYLSDFETGYNYVQKRYSFLANHGTQLLLELGIAYLLEKGATSELSRGMAFFYPELGIKMLFLETTLNEQNRYLKFGRMKEPLSLIKANFDDREEIGILGLGNLVGRMKGWELPFWMEAQMVFRS